jgi:ATP-dependent Clp protease protease subunit
MIVNIKGEIINDDYRRMINQLKDWGWPIVGDYFAPMDLKDAISSMPEGDKLAIKINSGGGDVLAGQEIYTILRGRDDVDIEIESLAASAASVIAMAGHCTISPVGMIMIHNVSTYGVSGNHQDMEQAAKELKSWDEALATSYVAKTGKPMDEILKMMDKETWLPANKAVELGFVDSISDPRNDKRLAASFGGTMQKYDDIMHMYERVKAEREKREAEKNELLGDLDQYGV